MTDEHPPARTRRLPEGRRRGSLVLPLVGLLSLGACGLFSSPKFQFGMRHETAVNMLRDGKIEEARDEFRELAAMPEVPADVRRPAATDLLSLRARDVGDPATAKDLTAIRTYVAEFNNLPEDVRALPGIEPRAVELLVTWAEEIGSTTPEAAVAAHQVLAAAAQMSDDPKLVELRDAAGEKIGAP